MSEEKYYEPNLDEFRLGFKYEYRSGEFMPKWSKREISLSSNEANSLVLLAHQLANKDIRVKYLGREDIEAEGWVYEKPQPKINFEETEKTYSFGDSWFMFHNEETNTCQIYMGGANTLEDIIFFQGTIKNRSELKKVMEMIGITK